MTSPFGNLTEVVRPGTLDLRALADQAAAEMRAESKRRPDPGPYFLAAFSAERGKRFRLPDAVLGIMNIGDAKVALFSWFRNLPGVAAWVIGSEVWAAKQTPEGAKHSAAEHQEHMDTGFRTLAAMGWVTVGEQIVIVAQNAGEVVNVIQPFIRRPRTGEIQLCGQPDAFTVPQSEYGGRMKMYGATEDDVLGYTRAGGGR